MSGTMEVEDLASFGRPLIEFPREAQREQGRIMLRRLLERYGAIGLARIAAELLVERRRLRRSFRPELTRYGDEIGPGVVMETVLLVSMFNVLARREGREGAYPILREMIEETAPHSMRALYDVDRLLRCEGDVFVNFREFHTALFDAPATQAAFPSTTTVESNDAFVTSISRCANVEIFRELGCPELAPFGCDHDLAGYPAIADEVQMEFRRPSTIAKGGASCEFRFYRDGTAPDTELIDGAVTPWVPSLNR